ncbi:aldo/keto reductase [Enterococcus sp. 669A]|uniref:Aldo/keto reductase n=2 Tax=Candidatus Enterococcus moelleringii TaxID=2815325 RepID=A0ABS3LD28_9ENTE|nr:aldo/keto reductase [Enterococcus sp. 669A]MBO1306274.1 aldo/keto reductase [Enterococcus sp. 669A]
MPMEGFGVFQVTDLAQCEEVVSKAIAAGYRLFDTASVYQNEAALGNAIRKSGVAREEFFITTKAYIQEMGYENTLKAFQQSIQKLGLDYLDLYLIHQPFGDYYGAWKAMEELYRAGKIRAIGVSNFYGSRLVDFCLHVNVVPAINQIELHPFYQRADELKLMAEYGVQPQAWSPFAEGMNDLFHNPTLETIAKKYNKSIAQVVLLWNIQRGVIVIPKSVQSERIAENLDIWDFELATKDMETIATLDTGKCLMFDPLDPSEVKRVIDYVKNPVLR